MTLKLRNQETQLEVQLQDGMMVGRVSSCDLTLADSSVSRQHAVLEKSAGRWRFRDLGSSNGVFLNGIRQEEAFFADGDVLAFGLVKFQVEAEAGFEAEVNAEADDVAETPAPQSKQPEVQLTAAERERARLRHEARSGRRSSGFGDLSQQTPIMQAVIVLAALGFFVVVVWAVRWAAHTVSGT